MRNHRGVSLIELVAAAFLVALSVPLVIQLVSAVSSTKRAETARSEIEGTVVALHRQILEIGRTSYGCSAISGATGLECSVGAGLLPTDGTVLVRFVQQGDGVDYQRQDTSGTFSTSGRYFGITRLVICDDDAMTSHGCSLQPLKLSIRHALDLVSPPDPNLTARFFRFGIEGGINKQ